MLPGLREHLEASGYSLYRRINADESIAWVYDPAAQSLISSYTVDDARTYLKRRLNKLASWHYDAGIEQFYGYSPSKAEMIGWREKESQAQAYQDWRNNGS